MARHGYLHRGLFPGFLADGFIPWNLALCLFVGRHCHHQGSDLGNSDLSARDVCHGPPGQFPAQRHVLELASVSVPFNGPAPSLSIFEGWRLACSI